MEQIEELNDNLPMFYTPQPKSKPRPNSLGGMDSPFLILQTPQSTSKKTPSSLEKTKRSPPISNIFNSPIKVTQSPRKHAQFIGIPKPTVSYNLLDEKTALKPSEFCFDLESFSGFFNIPPVDNDFFGLNSSKKKEETAFANTSEILLKEKRENETKTKNPPQEAPHPQKKTAISKPTIDDTSLLVNSTAENSSSNNYHRSSTSGFKTPTKKRKFSELYNSPTKSSSAKKRKKITHNLVGPFFSKISLGGAGDPKDLKNSESEKLRSSSVSLMKRPRNSSISTMPKLGKRKTSS